MEMEASSEEKAEFEEEMEYASYEDKRQLRLIISLVDKNSWTSFKVGTVVCKMGENRNTFRGYIAMLGVIKPYKKRHWLDRRQQSQIKEHRHFIRTKRLFHYYLNGVDAFHSKLLFPRQELHKQSMQVMSTLIWMALEECAGVHQRLVI